jgi:hypothetical protein
VLPVALVLGGIEAALIVGLSRLKSRHVEWPMTIMAVLSAVLLAAGVLRHYWDIWVHRTVRGISFIFVGIDAAGDLFSLFSVFLQPKLDILGMAIYGTELALWCGVFACGGYYNLRPWIRGKLSERTGNQSQQNRMQTASGGTGQGSTGSTNQVRLHDSTSSSSSVFSTPPGGNGNAQARLRANRAN